MMPAVRKRVAGAGLEADVVIRSSRFPGQLVDETLFWFRKTDHAVVDFVPLYGLNILDSSDSGTLLISIQKRNGRTKEIQLIPEPDQIDLWLATLQSLVQRMQGCYLRMGKRSLLGLVFWKGTCWFRLQQRTLLYYRPSDGPANPLGWLDIGDCNLTLNQSGKCVIIELESQSIMSPTSTSWVLQGSSPDVTRQWFEVLQNGAKAHKRLSPQASPGGSRKPLPLNLMHSPLSPPESPQPVFRQRSRSSLSSDSEADTTPQHAVLSALDPAALRTWSTPADSDGALTEESPGNSEPETPASTVAPKPTHSPCAEPALVGGC
mmetsp:Transcript_12079/g.27880  ORF Transcript_12079/g.27880 Transcript_12079/m.27880 type:complete len:320 (-) Transcript_12079:18-977(-)